MADETGTNCERCGRDVNGTPHRAMCGHPLKPITVDELAEIRATYESGGVAALGYSQVARLLDEIDRLADMLAAHLALESTDAAAGSYAGRAELPCITDGITGDEAYASATLDLTIDEIRTRVAGYAAATARAEQAEVALAEARAQLAKIGRTEDEWGVDCGVLGVLHTSRAEFGTAEKAIKTQQPLMHRLAGEWHEASLEYGANKQGTPAPYDVDKLTAPESERLSDEEFEQWASAWRQDAGHGRNATGGRCVNDGQRDGGDG